MTAQNTFTIRVDADDLARMDAAATRLERALSAANTAEPAHAYDRAIDDMYGALPVMRGLEFGIIATRLKAANPYRVKP